MRTESTTPSDPADDPMEPVPVSKLSSPHDLRGRITPPRFALDGVPFLDAFAIALLMLLLGNHLFFSPGLSIDLPTSLPGQTEMARIDSVATFSEQRLVLRSGVYHLNNLLDGLQEERLRVDHDDPVLLLKAPRETSLESLNRITTLARQAGFKTIHLAAHPSESSRPQ